MDPLRHSGRVRPREHSPEPRTTPERRVIARTTGPGQGHGESPPLSPRRTTEATHEAGPSSSLPPRTAVPRPLRTPAPGIASQQSVDGRASPDADLAAEARVSRPTPQAALDPVSPRSDDDAPSIDSPEQLLQELGALGIPGPLRPAQLLDLVALSAQRPDLEDRIRNVAAALTGQKFERGFKTELETLWRQHRHSHPVAAHLIEMIMSPESVTVTTAASPEHGNEESDFDTDLEADLDAHVGNQREVPLDDSDGEAGLEGGLDGDVKLLEAPLGDQIQAWMGNAAVRVAPDLHAFDDEPRAPAFARMLERLRDETLPEFSPTAMALLSRQVGTVLLAVARDATLRDQVYLVS